MAEFAYNNSKHASIWYMPFELNCRYYPCVSYKNDVDPRSKSKVADKLTEKLRNLIVACRENYNTPKNYKNKPTIKELSLEVTFPARNFS